MTPILLGYTLSALLVHGGAREPHSAVVRLCAAPALEFGTSEAQFAARFGAPRKRRVTNVRNGHERQQIDERIDLTYRGLEAVLYRIPSTGRTFLAELRLKRNHAGLALPFAFGDGRAAVIRRLNHPDSTRGETLSYACSYEGGGVLRVHLRKGRVAMVEWSTWPD